jgi:RHS repeat-associated protein
VKYDAMNRPVSDGLFTYAYDALGNRTERAGPRGVTRYRYSRQNLLTHVERPDGATVDCAYDAFGRRLRKTCGDTTTIYVWAGHQLVQEVVESAGERVTREYLYAPGTGRPLAMQYAGAVYAYHCDPLGTPQLLTDARGEVAWSAQYRAYGAVTVDVERVSQPLRFRGQIYDGELGLYYNVARHYDPRLGVYLTRDPLGAVGGMNVYQYADGNPVNVVDPLGLFGESWPGWVKTTVSVVGAVAVGAAVGALAVAAAPAVLGVAALSTAAIATGIIAGGIAGGAVGGGLSAAMTQGGCVPCALLRGAALGLFGSLFFVAALPFELGIAGIMAVGGVAGGATYVADWATSDRPWSTTEFLESAALGAALGGLGKWVGDAVFGKTPEEAPAKPVVRTGPDPETVARTGEPTTVRTGDPNDPNPKLRRPSEKPYTRPANLQETGPDKPPPTLDPSQGKYLWQITPDGTVQVAPETQPEGFGKTDLCPDGRDLKHGDMNPSPDGQTRGTNRAGGELVPVMDENGQPTGKWIMNNDSSNTFMRSDGVESTPDNLRASKQVMQQSGMDTSNFQLQDYNGNPISE